MKLSKSIEQKANAIQQDVITIKEGQQYIKNELETMPEKTAGEVVKAMAQPMKDEAGNIMDCTKEQADRLEKKITANVLEQNRALLEAYLGPLPHPGDSPSSSTSKIDRSINHAKKLRAGADAAAKAKGRPKAKGKSKAKAAAIASSSSSSSSSSASDAGDAGDASEEV